MTYWQIRKAVVKAFGAWGPKKFMGKSYDGILRSSFSLIDEQGVVTEVISKVKTKTHGSDILALLKTQ